MLEIKVVRPSAAIPADTRIFIGMKMDILAANWTFPRRRDRIRNVRCPA